MSTGPMPHMYLRSEITSAIAAAMLTLLQFQQVAAVPDEYTRGYTDALRALSVTFGVEMPAQSQRNAPR